MTFYHVLCHDQTIATWEEPCPDPIKVIHLLSEEELIQENSQSQGLDMAHSIHFPELLGATTKPHSWAKALPPMLRKRVYQELQNTL